MAAAKARAAKGAVKTAVAAAVGSDNDDSDEEESEDRGFTTTKKPKRGSAKDKKIGGRPVGRPRKTPAADPKNKEPKKRQPKTPKSSSSDEAKLERSRWTAEAHLGECYLDAPMGHSG